MPPVPSPHQMPLRAMRDRMPCGPVRISAKNDSSATHTMGETSRPLKGGTTLRVAASSGSAIGGGKGREAGDEAAQSSWLQG